MPRKGYIQTDTHRKAISLAHLGKLSDRRGKTYEEIYGVERAKELKEKDRFAKLGKPSKLLGKTYEEIFGIEKAAQMRKAKKGNKHALGSKRSPATKEKQRFAKLGKHHSPERIEKNRISHLRENLSPATRKKQSLAKLGKRRPDISGPNCHLYRDGKSNEPYGVEFTSALRLKIRKRDDFMCQFPGCGKLENGKAHAVHHIDHNKHNNNELNLITLDCGCHSKEKLMALDEAIIMFEDILRIRNILR